MAKRVFGELELSILRILKSGKKMTVKEIHKILGNNDKYNTVMTVMFRLTEKKFLARERIGLQYQYWLLSQPDKIPSFLQQVKKKVFGFKTSELISYLIDSAEDISDEDIVEMEKMVEKFKQKRKAKL